MDTARISVAGRIADGLPRLALLTSGSEVIRRSSGGRADKEPALPGRFRSLPLGHFVPKGRVWGGSPTSIFAGPRLCEKCKCVHTCIACRYAYVCPHIPSLPFCALPETGAFLGVAYPLPSDNSLGFPILHRDTLQSFCGVFICPFNKRIKNWEKILSHFRQ